MDEKNSSTSKFSAFNRNLAAMVLFWTLLTLGSLIWDIYKTRKDAVEHARNEALATFNKDQAFRSWATKHGGVYVPITDETPPNPYLKDIPDRDIQLPSGKPMTLMNPAYMLRQAMGEYESLYGVKGHITSLKPLNPINKPDEWERKALEGFERGEEEVVDVMDIDGAPHLRLIRPMVTKEGCLKCHAFQGYAEGDIRGGVSVSVPMAPYLESEKKTINSHIFSHVAMWLIGILGIIGVAYIGRRGISSQAQAEEELRKSEEKLRGFFSQAIDGCFFMMLDGPVRWDGSIDKEKVLDHVFAHQRITQINDAMLAQYGANIEQMMDLTPNDLFEHDVEHGRDLWRRCFDAGNIHLESHERKMDGTPIWIEGEYIVLHDSDGRITGHFGIQRDITERKKMEEQHKRLVYDLRERIKELTALHKTASLMRDEGKTENELIREMVSILPPAWQYPEITSARILYGDIEVKTPNFAQTPWMQKAEFKTTDGKKGMIEISYLEERPAEAEGPFFAEERSLINSLAEMLRSYIDQKQGEKLVKELAAIVESSNDAIIGKTPDGIISSWNKSSEKIYGYSADEIIGKPVTVLAPPERRAELLEMLEKTCKGETVVNYESERIRKDGALIQVALTLSPMRDTSGNIIGISTIARDITDKKRMEAKLLQFGAYNRSLIEASLDPLVTISPEGKVTDVNAATEKATGRSREELIGTDFSDYFTEPEKAREGYKKVLAEGMVLDYSLTIRNTSGMTTDVLYNASIYKNERGELQGIFAAARDVTERKKAETKLIESEKYARMLIEHSPIAMLVDVGVDADEKIIMMNNKFTKLFGYTMEDIPDVRHWWPLAYPDEKYREEVRVEWIKKVKKAIENRTEIEPMETTVVCKDGTQRYIKFYLTSIGERNLIAFENLTERKLAEDKIKKSETSLKRAQEVAHIGSWFLDLTKNELLWTDESYHIFGVPEGTSLTYERFLETVHPDDREYVHMAWTAAMNGAPYDIEHRLFVEGGTKWVREKAEVEFDEKGKALRGIGITHDITDRKLKDEELRKYREHLEDLVKERTSQLEATNKELEAFSYSVSHDLRAPLRAIDGFSRIIMDDYFDKLDEDGKKNLAFVRSNAQKMEQLIDDILAFSRMGRKEIMQSEIDMNQLARAVFDEISLANRGRSVQFNLKDLPPANGDTAMINQVYTNLFSNAFKFTRKKEMATIEAGGWVEGNENVYYVKDNGAGFDMNYVEKIFGVFQRLHSVEEFEGSGVGLAIFKRIIQRHGGRVWAEGKVNEGATFYFTLPKEVGK